MSVEQDSNDWITPGSMTKNGCRVLPASPSNLKTFTLSVRFTQQCYGLTLFFFAVDILLYGVITYSFSVFHLIHDFLL